MKVYLNKPIETLEGEPIQVDGNIATLGKVASKSLMNSTSKNYLDKVDLAKKILHCTSESMTMTTGDVELIKTAVKEMNFTAQMVYQFEQAIDPTEEEDGDKE